MTKFTYVLLFLLLIPNIAFSRCVIFIMGGIVDKPYQSRGKLSYNEDRIRFIQEKAKKRGCQSYVYKNQSLENIERHLNKVVKSTKLNNKDKIHMTFVDHGTPSSLPLMAKEHVKYNRLIKSFGEIFQKDTQFTYSSQVCWPAFHEEVISQENHPLNICGGSSVSREFTSSAFKELGDKYRSKEYAPALMNYLSSNKSSSLFTAHYFHANNQDTDNLLRGRSLSSLTYLKSIHETLGKTDFQPAQAIDLEQSSFQTLERAIDQWIDPFEKLYCNLENPLSFLKIKAFSNDIEEISKNLSLSELDKNIKKYPILKNFQSAQKYLKKEMEKNTRNRRALFEGFKELKQAQQKYKELGAMLTKPKILTQIRQDMEKDLKESKASFDLLDYRYNQFRSKYKHLISDQYLEVLYKDYPDTNLSAMIRAGLENKYYESASLTKEKLGNLGKVFLPLAKIESEINMVNDLFKLGSKKQITKFLGLLKCETSPVL